MDTTDAAVGRVVRACGRDVNDEGDAPAVNASGSQVNVNGGQAAQIGEKNTMYNTWYSKESLDLASLNALNPDAAVDRLRQVPHNELVDFFVRASSHDVADLLAAFLRIDSTKVVATLADIRGSTSEPLIATLTTEAPWLGTLPDEVQAIGLRVEEQGWRTVGRLKLVYLDPDTDKKIFKGYIRKCEKGRVFWCSRYGAHAVDGAIDDRLSGEPWLGFPVSERRRAPNSPFGVSGICQSFEYGVIYSSKYGIYILGDATDRRYAHEGRTGGWLGFPMCDMTATLPCQLFEGGAIYRGYAEDLYLVSRSVLNKLPHGLWYPVSDEGPVPASPYSTEGTAQEFRNVSGARVVVYSSEQLGIEIVSGRELEYYDTHGATRSWLGFPMDGNSSRMFRRTPREASDTHEQHFEGGVLYRRRSSYPIGVPSATVNLLSRQLEINERLGWPISDESPTGASGGNRIQPFYHGAVIVRNGKRKIKLDRSLILRIWILQLVDSLGEFWRAFWTNA
jgi:hypothetical protein